MKWPAKTKVTRLQIPSITPRPNCMTTGKVMEWSIDFDCEFHLLSMSLMVGREVVLKGALA